MELSTIYVFLMGVEFLDRVIQLRNCMKYITHKLCDILWLPISGEMFLCDSRCILWPKFHQSGFTSEVRFWSLYPCPLLKEVYNSHLGEASYYFFRSSLMSIIKMVFWSFCFQFFDLTHQLFSTYHHRTARIPYLYVIPSLLRMHSSKSQRLCWGCSKNLEWTKYPVYMPRIYIQIYPTPSSKPRPIHSQIWHLSWNCVKL